MGVPLGPFELLHPLGRGGMGEVWSARHAPTGSPVAVKLLTSARSRVSGFGAAFAREIRAVARLSHPGIVHVLDSGETPTGFETVPDGSPWLAMELAEGGTLRPHCGQLPWSRTREILLQLLDALAHAHARGIVHLDIKPSNVLLGGMRPGPKLSDFGIAMQDDDAAPIGISGTPSFMAPEQLEGAWRDLGPWTDLYALGCLTWALVTGSPPYGVLSTVEARAAHLRREPDRLVGACPPELDDWVRLLLRKPPGDRPACAADAARLLRQLPLDAPTLGRPASVAAPDATMSAADWSPTSTWALQSTAFLGQVVDTPGFPARAAARPPFPADWRRPEGAGSTGLTGVGLGLYGLRSVPLVGRTAERDRLWQALATVHREGSPRAVVIRGEAGTGKSRLAAWLCRRAHETGAATSVRAVHGDPAGPSDGLVPMIEQRLRTVGLDRSGVERRVRVSLGDAGPIVDLLRPTPGGRQADPVSVAVRVLGAWARERPLVVWLDDVQWGPDALDLAAALLDSGLPMLVVLTVRDEALDSRPVAAERLESLRHHPSCDLVSLKPLGPEERRALVRVLLGLTGELADEVADRAGGNPLFAVQLVGDWVARGVLVPRDDGFALAPGATAPIPDAIHELWRDRLDAVLAGRPESDRAALELAAVLGLDVDVDEWAAACKKAEVEPTTDLADAIRIRGLAEDRDGGWRFAHGLLAESLRRLAADRGRSPEYLRAASRALHDLGAQDLHHGDLGRADVRLSRARTLLAGRVERGRGDAALLLASVRSKLGDDESSVRRLIEEAEVLAQQLSDDHLQATVFHARGVVDVAATRLLEARTSFEKALTLASKVQDARLELTSLVNLSHASAELGDHARAHELLADALERVGSNDEIGRAKVLTALLNIHEDMGDLDQADAFARMAIEIYRTHGHERSMAVVMVRRAAMLLVRGEAAEARAMAREALEIRRRSGDVVGQTHALQQLSRAYAACGEPERARATLDELIALARNHHLHSRLANGLHAKARYARDRGDWAEVAAAISEAVDHFQSGDRVYAISARGELAEALIHLGSLDEARATLEAGEEGLAALPAPLRNDLEAPFARVRELLQDRTQPGA